MGSFKVLTGSASSKDIHLHKNETLGLVETQDLRPILQKIQDVLCALGNHFKTIIDRCGRRIAAKGIPTPFILDGKTYTYAPAELPWMAAKKSEGLYLLIHGLRGSATDWDRYVEEIQARNPGAHLFAPAVPLRGNCDLQTAAQPLFEVVKHYLKKHPGKPVTLIGTSNGGRIAKYIETRLRPSLVGSSRLSVVSIAGVHYGTQMIGLAKRVGVLPVMRFEKSFEEEVSFASSLAKKDLSAWRAKQRVWKKKQVSVRHFFGATTEDENVRSLASSLPYQKGSKSVYQVVSGQSHISIVDGIRNDVMEWMTHEHH